MSRAISILRNRENRASVSCRLGSLGEVAEAMVVLTQSVPTVSWVTVRRWEGRILPGCGQDDRWD